MEAIPELSQILKNKTQNLILNFFIGIQFQQKTTGDFFLRKEQK